MARDRKLLFWILVIFLATLLSHGKNSGQGDEPHYMMIAHSLWFDRDLDLKNNYEDKNNIVYAGNLVPEQHLVEGRGQRLYSIHSIGLPLAALPVFGPAYEIASRVPEKTLAPARMTRWTLLRLFLAIAMIFLTACLALLIYRYLMDRFEIQRRYAFLVTLVSFLACPLLPLGFLFFTEMPAAFLGFVAFRRTDVLTFREALVRALATSFLPFLHVKYLPLSGVLVCFLLWDCWKATDRNRNVVAAIAIYALGQISLVLMNYWCWGSFLPYAAYGGIPLSTSVWGIGIPGLLLDQEFGLLWVAPLYLLAIPGAVVMWKKGQHGDVIRMILALGSLLSMFANFGMWWGGWSPFSRFLTPVVVFLIPMVAAAVQALWNLRIQGIVVKALVLYQLLLGLYFWQHPRMMWNHADGQSQLFGSFGRWLPSIINLQERDIQLCLFWTAIILVLNIFFVMSLKSEMPAQVTTKAE